MNNSKIFVVSHKKFNCPPINNYSTILVGKKDFEMKNSYRDDEGTNIASKNSSFCELTGLYWIWKNYKGNEKWLGLVHYRRYFSNTSLFNDYRFFLNDKKISQIMSKKDCILPKPLAVKNTVAKNYYQNGEGKLKDLNTTGKVIKRLYPEYYSTYNKVLKDTKASYCNMMIMARKYFNEYCQWLFDILFQVEKETDITNYSKSEKRIYGYLSEILLNVWVKYKKLNVKYMPVVFTEESEMRRLKKALIG